jgi:SAM-dependent methyltransferase
MLPFDAWMASLESRHLADLTFPEVTRGLRALSSAYVERRERIAEGGVFSGAGKRAAFALFYGPLHYLLVRHIVSVLPGATSVTRIVDLGCGTGAAGAAWAAATEPPAAIVGFDRHPWAVAEAGVTYRAFGLERKVRAFDLARGDAPAERGAWLAAFTMNELPAPARERLLGQCLERAGRGEHVLIVEPIAKSSSPWWAAWQRKVEDVGGRADEWRVRVDLPALVAKLDRAAGLNHRELTGRSLWL